MFYSLQQAADATGKSKSTIQRAIKGGKISADMDAHGNYQINPAELHRVYPPQALRDELQEAKRDNAQQPNFFVETAVLRAELQQMRERLASVDLERDRERKEAADQIIDLRRRLDVEAEARRAEGEERRKLTAILTDQRTKAAEPQSTPAHTATHTPPEPKGLRGLLHRWTA